VSIGYTLTRWVKLKNASKNMINKKEMPCNKPKAQSSGGKSHVVKACYNGIEKIIRFGQKLELVQLVNLKLVNLTK
jgi:hypothetical protein